MRNRVFMLVATFFLCGSLLPHGDASAQTAQTGLAPTLPSASAASYYYIAKPGELTMQVNIWGSVERPGRYEVPTSTDLVQLLSYAGGPARDASLDNVRITRVLKKEGGISKTLLGVNLEDLSRVEQSTLVLYPGDTIYLDHSSWATVTNVFTVVSTLAVVTAAVTQIIIAKSYSNR